MMSAIRVFNLRSLRDTGFIDLKKINILLGVNSSGKSTFLRSFPLLAQSIKRDLRNAISWFDDSSVDFGDYRSSKCAFAAEADCIGFEYRLESPRQAYHYLLFSKYGRRIGQNLSDGITVRIDYADDDFGTYLKSVQFDLNSIQYHVSVNHRNSALHFGVNGADVDELVTMRYSEANHRGIIPEIVIDFPQRQQGFSPEIDEISDLYASQLRIALMRYCSKKLRNDSRLQEIIDNWSYDKKRFLLFLQNEVSISSFKNKARKWSIEDPAFVSLYNKVALVYCFALFPTINEELTSFYRNCGYIAPIRAEANRYYRNQGLQVEEVDAYGRNLQEFVSSLNDEQMESYNKFCENVLGVGVSVDPSGGLNSIMIKNKSGRYNLSDVGFGYSQILPIVTKLWYSSQLLSSNMRLRLDSLSRTFLIEQPELHLHPAMQAKIADAFIECSRPYAQTFMNREYKLNRCLILETHSAAIINRIGRRVREKKIAPEDINIIFFEKGPDGGETTIRQISFDEDGRLKNWPYGFFDPND